MSNTTHEAAGAEAAFLAEAAPALRALDALVDGVSFDASRSVLHVVVRLPSESDASLRRHVGAIISQFEDQFGSLIVEPTFRLGLPVPKLSLDVLWRTTTEVDLSTVFHVASQPAERG